MAILTKKSKIFIKAKLTVSKSYLLGLVYFMISCILRGALILINFFQEKGALSDFDFPPFPYTFSHSFMLPIHFGCHTFLILSHFLAHSECLSESFGVIHTHRVFRVLLSITQVWKEFGKQESP